ncbi:MAG: SHOCT domain-containing protein [Candidatus Cyclobacteriaceae bacterium M3_2C_046]
MNGFFGMGAGWIWWLLILVIIILVIWLVMRSSNSNSRNAPQKESAREVLEKKYANGEISTEEYRERKRELNS